MPSDRSPLKNIQLSSMDSPSSDVDAYKRDSLGPSASERHGAEAWGPGGNNWIVELHAGLEEADSLLADAQHDNAHTLSGGFYARSSADAVFTPDVLEKAKSSTFNLFDDCESSSSSSAPHVPSAAVSEASSELSVQPTE
eukprot:350952-Rhodomonas_salina.1